MDTKQMPRNGYGYVVGLLMLLAASSFSNMAGEDGVVVENTDDGYAQDLDGNVWYCGEVSRNFELFEGDNPLESELVDVDGSWTAFRDGAKPGILVKAFPVVSDINRQAPRSLSDYMSKPVTMVHQLTKTMIAA